LCEKTRENLLLESDNLTLGSALEITVLRQLSSILLCCEARHVVPHGHPCSAAAACLSHALQCPVCRCHRSEASFTVQLTQRQNNRRTSEVCGYCGSRSHNSKAQCSPARGQQCRNCMKQNHFAKMCHSAPADLSPHMGHPSAHHRAVM